jgi:hypothetical protein
MSILDAAEAVCPQCGATAEVTLVVSVNAVRRPDLRVAILDGSFQAVACPNCATMMRLPPEFIYLDLHRGQWIAIHPSDRLPEWPRLETAARAIFDSSFGDGASEATRGLFDDVVPRIAFGWPALREKLLCADFGLNDTFLEVLKLELMRNAEGAPYADDIDIRLVEGDADTLAFDWVSTRDEYVAASMSVPRRAYDDLSADPAPYAALTAPLDGQLFIDLRRLLLSQEIAEAD